MANKKKSYKNQKAKRIRNKAKREGITPQEVIANANKLEEERKIEKEAKQREKARADREQRLDDINNRPKISLEEDSKRFIESMELDSLHDELKSWGPNEIQQKWQDKIDLEVEERLYDRQSIIDSKNEEGMARWKEQQRQREHAVLEQEYNDWFKSDDYYNQEVDLRLKQREAVKIEAEARKYEQV